MFFSPRLAKIIHIHYKTDTHGDKNMYNITFINKILQKRKSLSIRQLALKYDLSPQTIHKWEKGGLPKRTRNRPNTKLDINLLIADIKAHPRSFQYERAQRLGVSDTCIFNNMKKLGVTYPQENRTNNNQRKYAILATA